MMNDRWTPSDTQCSIGLWRCKLKIIFMFLWFMVFNATFNNIAVIWWRSVVLLEEIRLHRENHRPVASNCQTLSHNVVSSTPRHDGGLNSQC